MMLNTKLLTKLNMQLDNMLFKKQDNILDVSYYFSFLYCVMLLFEH